MNMPDNSDLLRSARRRFLLRAGAFAIAAPLSALAAPDTGEGIEFAAGPRPLVRYPGKRPMILVHSRPPHLETPFATFNESVLTPNNAFFVRYHLADLPTRIDPSQYRLTVTGTVRSPLSLTLSELKRLGPTVEVVAVNQCSGNSRGYASPRVFGAQLGNGAMGNARWTGIPLRAVLERAGVGADARQVTFNGLDKPVLPSTPDFRKALDIEHALSAEPMIAWAMNGEELPFLNGYPLRLVVPGYFGTYWVKHLSEIEVIDHEFEGKDSFFMSKGYRLPDTDCLCVAPGTAADKTRPISTLAIRSFITNLTHDSRIRAGSAFDIKGIAFDAGAGIRSVELSSDGGQRWLPAVLGEDLGRFSFRPWRLRTTLSDKGPAHLMVRATGNQGEVQPTAATWNPAGYRRNVIESITVTVV
jgi:sulfite dehydrogenase (cytochrome) subunit A